MTRTLPSAGPTEEPVTPEDLARLGAVDPADRIRAAAAAVPPSEQEDHPLDADVDHSSEPEAPVGDSGPANPEDREDERGVPLWAARAVPPGRALPAGTVPVFVRMRPALTRDKREHVVVLWELSVKDEHLAKKRTRGDAGRTVEELAKQCIRYWDDGEVADWGGRAQVGAAPGNVDRLWENVGAKYRARLTSLYLAIHSMSATEAADFFLNCVKSRHAAG